MNFKNILTQLAENKKSFENLLNVKDEKEIFFKPAPEKWCLLEIVSHLYDEEKEDFRTRVKHVLEKPGQKLPPIDPVGWVEERNYIKNDFNETKKNFFQEREESIKWLKSLKNPDFKLFYKHPKFGKMTAEMFLVNWLAHDYLHMRQIIFNKYSSLKRITEETLDYAGVW